MEQQWHWYYDPWNVVAAIAIGVVGAGLGIALAVMV